MIGKGALALHAGRPRAGGAPIGAWRSGACMWVPGVATVVPGASSRLVPEALPLEARTASPPPPDRREISRQVRTPRYLYSLQVTIVHLPQLPQTFSRVSVSMGGDCRAAPPTEQAAVGQPAGLRDAGKVCVPRAMLCLQRGVRRPGEDQRSLAPRLMSGYLWGEEEGGDPVQFLGGSSFARYPSYLMS